MRISDIINYRFKSDQKENLLSRSKVFCMSPWIQLHAQTNGKVSPCCMSSVRDGNEIGDLKTNPDLSASWNSENMRKLRKNMLNNKKSSICSNCYVHEKYGKFSERMQYNQDFADYFSRIGNTLDNGTLLEESVPVIDIRFSNKCNYKCRICCSEYSSLWHEDELKLFQLYPRKKQSLFYKAWDSLKTKGRFFQIIEFLILRFLYVVFNFRYIKTLKILH